MGPQDGARPKIGSGAGTYGEAPGGFDALTKITKNTYGPHENTYVVSKVQNVSERAPSKTHGAKAGRPLPSQALSARGPREHSVRSSSYHGGMAIVERHVNPPHWYNCNRPLYG